MAPPPDVDALLAVAAGLRGLSIGELAASVDVAPPTSLGSAKGWVGELVERALGAVGGNDAAPDFPDLGVELKTIPVRANGTPVESTWVTRVALNPEQAALPFDESPVGRKLARVLFVPVESSRQRWLDRRLGRALLWTPDPRERAELMGDYDDLMAMILQGRVDEISAGLGGALQVRPKGRDGRSRSRAIGADGFATWTSTRGFYLRARFTHRVLRRIAGGRGLFPAGERGASLAP